MIIREKIEHEISFTSEEVGTIRKFRDFLLNLNEEEWEILGEEFKANEYEPSPSSNDMTLLFELVDDFYSFARIN